MLELEPPGIVVVVHAGNSLHRPKNLNLGCDSAWAFEGRRTGQEGPLRDHKDGRCTMLACRVPSIDQGLQCTRRMSVHTNVERNVTPQPKQKLPDRHRFHHHPLPRNPWGRKFPALNWDSPCRGREQWSKTSLRPSLKPWLAGYHALDSSPSFYSNLISSSEEKNNEKWYENSDFGLLI